MINPYYFFALAITLVATLKGEVINEGTWETSSLRRGVLEQWSKVSQSGETVQTLKDLPLLRETVNELADSHSSNKDKISSLAYCAHRLGALCISMAFLTQENGTSDEQRQTGKVYEGLSVKYLEIGAVAALTSQMDGASIKDRVDKLVQVYINEMRQAKLTTNTFLSTPIQAELDIIADLEPIVLLQALKHLAEQNP